MAEAAGEFTASAHKSIYFVSQEQNEHTKEQLVLIIGEIASVVHICPVFKFEQYAQLNDFKLQTFNHSRAMADYPAHML